MNTNKITLEPNTPVQVSLSSQDGNIIWEGNVPKEMHYHLVDGRSLYLPIELGASIMNLGLAEKEPFFICRYSSKDRLVKDKINVWLTPAGEKARAELERQRQESERDTMLERQLAASIHEAQTTRKPPAPEYTPLGNGTTGPVAVPRQTPAALTPLCSRLLVDTKNLLTVYSEAVRHAEELGVPPGVVRSVMLSAYIGLNQRGRGAA